MPFTPAHIAAVLPVLRWRGRLRLDATCLVVGSMGPDLEYFARGELTGRFGHTLIGIAAWGVPATLAVAAAFHFAVKWPLLLCAPRAIAERAVRAIHHRWPPGWSAAALASLVMSAALGNLTHVAWDACTHHDGWVVERWARLSDPIALAGLGTMVGFRLLQHLSTVVGLIALAVVVVRRARRTAPVALPPAPRAGPRALLALCVALAVAALDGRLALLGERQPGHFVAAAISGLLAGALVASALLWRRTLTWRAAVDQTLVKPPSTASV
jgi:hypothetical protein